MMGGTAGAGMGTTGAITARDIGLTSLDLQQRGETMAGQAAGVGSNILAGGTNLLSFARNYLMPQPVNPMSLLPLSDLVSASEWSKAATFQANEAMYTAMGNVAAAKFGAPTTSLLGGIGGDISGILGNLTKSPSGQSGGSGSFLSSILGMFGGGGGSGITGAGMGQSTGGFGGMIGSGGVPNV
jgi:hypothetical protein